MLHATSESDVTSLGSQSSPKQAAYYVQSPSRDSHDGDKSSASINATTPVYTTTPSDSPSHPSYPRHSLASSASRFSGPFRTKGSRRRNDCSWPECAPIREEVDYDEFYGRGGNFSRTCQSLIFILGFAAIFGMFCLIIWGASRPYEPHIAVKSLIVKEFYYGQGSDLTGVPTRFLTVNCSVKMTVRNPATFFGIHVSSSSIKLMFSEIPVASGQLVRYYQPRGSHRTVLVKLEGIGVPLYGAGASLATADANGGVPLTLLLAVRSQGDVIGKLVRSIHGRRASCRLLINSRDTRTVRFGDDSCAYT